MYSIVPKCAYVEATLLWVTSMYNDINIPVGGWWVSARPKSF